jgi:hypothetical protein
VKDVGEPGAGEPHARIDGRGLETERYGVTAPALDPTNLLVIDLLELSANVHRSPCTYVPVVTQLVTRSSPGRLVLTVGGRCRVDG